MQPTDDQYGICRPDSANFGNDCAPGFIATLLIASTRLGWKQQSPDAYPVRSNFLHSCCNHLQSKLAAVLNGAAIFICALVGLWLDELVDDALQPAEGPVNSAWAFQMAQIPDTCAFATSGGTKPACRGCCLLRPKPWQPTFGVSISPVFIWIQQSKQPMCWELVYSAIQMSGASRPRF